VRAHFIIAVGVVVRCSVCCGVLVVVIVVVVVIVTSSNRTKQCDHSMHMRALHNSPRSRSHAMLVISRRITSGVIVSVDVVDGQIGIAVELVVDRVGWRCRHAVDDRRTLHCRCASVAIAAAHTHTHTHTHTRARAHAREKRR
jgi:hypothetical protein